MRNFLDTIRASAERRARDARKIGDQLLTACDDLAPAPSLELSEEGFDLIAEVKRRAPSAGLFDETTGKPHERAASYVAAGASAISVLTEPEHFGGSLGDLHSVATHVTVPVLAKDFFVDPAQLFEARASGAAGALLIVRMLDEDTMNRMVDAAARVGLFLLIESLIESFDERDLERSVPALDRCDAAGVTALAGVNARNLDTLEVHFERFGELRGRIPDGIPAIAESGITRPEQAAAVARLGYRGALIGSALMRVAAKSRGQWSTPAAVRSPP